MPSTLKQGVDGSRIDPLVERVLSDPKLGRIVILDEGVRSDTYTSHPNAIVGDRGRLRALALAAAFVRVPSLIAQARPEFEIVDNALRRMLDYPSPITLRQWTLRLAYFIEGRRTFRAALRATGAKRFVVAGYQMNNGCVQAARDLGIQTIEMQHGAITPYQLTHHYPGRPNIPMMADLLLSFGSFWTSHVQLPGNMAAAVVGSERIAKLRASRHRQPRMVLVTSQIPTNPALFALARAAATTAKDWQFVFRPHPFEDLNAYQAAPMPNFRLSGPADSPYSLLADSDVQVGVSSTMLFEGMALGVRTIVVDLPGSEAVRPIVDRGDAALVRTADELVAALQTAPVARVISQYFADPVPSVAEAIAQATNTR